MIIAHAAHPRAGTLRRHGRGAECPICGGHSGLSQGRGVRCAGFSLDHVAFCTREEYAGRLPLDITTSPPAYRHRLFGRCDCGTEHGWNAVGAASPSPVAAKRQATLPRPIRHAVSSRALELLGLRDAALADLAGRGLPREVAWGAGYRSIPRRGSEHRRFLAELVDGFGEELVRRCPGFTDKNSRLTFWSASPTRDGYLVPYRDEAGRVTGLQAKILGGKYLTARGTRLAALEQTVRPRMLHGGRKR